MRYTVWKAPDDGGDADEFTLAAGAAVPRGDTAGMRPFKIIEAPDWEEALRQFAAWLATYGDPEAER